MDQSLKRICKDAEQDHEYIVGLRRWFHQHPELSAEEEQTACRIEQELDLLGLPHHRSAKTGVVTEITGTKGEGDRTVALRADIDALPVLEEHHCEYESQTPGVMHACGHDAHAASLLGAVRILNRNRDLFAGRIIIFFQPGEEIGYGARIMIAEGALNGADRTFGIHTASYLPRGTVAIVPGPVNASVDQFRILVHGRSSHVSRPHLGVDALYIAAQIVVGVQALITRRISPMQNVLIGIGRLNAGTAYNIVAQEAEIEGTVRTFDKEVRAQIQKELQELAEHTAAMYGGTAEFINRDNTSPLLNDPQASQEAQKVAGEILGGEHVIGNMEASLQGDDMAELINEVPGVYCFLGSCDPERPDTTGAAHHNSHFDIDERELLDASELYAAYAVKYLNHEI